MAQLLGQSATIAVCAPEDMRRTVRGKWYIDLLQNQMVIIAACISTQVGQPGVITVFVLGENEQCLGDPLH